MSASIKSAHFDALAPRWDAIKPPEGSAVVVARGLDRVEPLLGKVVVDVGCGTGLLEEHLLHRIGDGRVIALDFAPAMIARARERHADPRVHWICSDVVEAAIECGSSRVLCALVAAGRGVASLARRGTRAARRDSRSGGSADRRGRASAHRRAFRSVRNCVFGREAGRGG
jgi:SAM-dependent methyltransferase